MSENVKEITNYLFLRATPQVTDLALVFGTSQPEVIQRTWDLYRRGLVPKILVSGGVACPGGKNEAQTIKDGLVSLGVPEEVIITEEKATNTLENVLFSKKILEADGSLAKIKKITAVVKNFHSRRVLMTLKRHFPSGIKFFPAVYDAYNFSRDTWPDSEAGREKVLSEWHKIPKYLAQGDLQELSAADEESFK
jgi:uncharacterized SAM-binding protein YcdF (DUF218 family)